MKENIVMGTGSMRVVGGGYMSSDGYHQEEVMQGGCANTCSGNCQQKRAEDKSCHCHGTDTMQVVGGYINTGGEITRLPGGLHYKKEHCCSCHNGHDTVVLPEEDDTICDWEYIKDIFPSKTEEEERRVALAHIREKLHNLREEPRRGEIWKHFKDNLYEIVACPVEHTETGEVCVCYRALYGEFRTYIRPLDMFMSKVDRQKYPDVLQEYRFEKLAD